MTEVLTSPAGELAWEHRYSGALMNTFGPPQRVLVRGEGCYVWDADGVRYLDLLGGIAVNVLGHAHPTLTGAIGAQLNTLGHVSNFFASPTQITLAERLLALAVRPGTAVPSGSRVFFTNSGTEALEAAVKLALKHGGPGRRRVLALEGAFHGRSLGALALTHKAAYKEPYGDAAVDVVHLPFGDVEALEGALAEGGVCALVVEPVQGEAGVKPLPPGYLERARELTRAHDALLILDEVQSGMGRTGAWMAHHQPEIGGVGDAAVVPDAIALAKGLGGGFPIGALVALGDGPATTLTPGSHGTTFGGNPVACAAGLATIHVIERDGLLDAVAERGAWLQAALGAIGHPLITGTRGLGLLLAVELAAPVSSDVARAALTAGYVVNAVSPTAIRLAPPYVLTHAQAEAFVADLPGILDDTEAHR